MSIDWSKPLRLTHGATTKSSTVAHVLTQCKLTGNSLIEWQAESDGSNCQAFVDKNGTLIATLHGGAHGHKYQFVENVPEEPKNTLMLYREASWNPDEWMLYRYIAETRSDALKMKQKCIDNGLNRTVVLVTLPSETAKVEDKVVQSIAQMAKSAPKTPYELGFSNGQLSASIQYVREHARREEHVKGGDAPIFERVCRAAEEVLNWKMAKKDPAVRS